MPTKNIFGKWDLICWRGYNFRLIQLATLEDKDIKLKKIYNFMEHNKLYFDGDVINGELWCWDEENKKFIMFGIET